MIPHSRPAIGEGEVAAVARVLESGMVAQGAEVEAFEAECAAFVGRRYGVAVNSGTSALHVALAAVGVEPGESVAIPSYACAALATAIGLQGAQPVLCDVTEDYNLEPTAVADTCRTAIVPHLFGAPARLPDAPTVIEDIAQSIGGDTGREGRVTVASFYATKLLTTGEGGMVLTDDLAIAEFARDRRDYDNRDDFVQRFPYKMTDIQAAIGRVQLRRLPEFIERRRAIAERYTAAFRGLPVRLPDIAGHVFYRYVVATPQRDAIEAHLAESGVEAKGPVYRPAHHYLGGNFPRSERAHGEALSLPLYPSLLEQEIERVIDSLISFFD